MSEIMAQRYELLSIIPTSMTEEEAGAVETRISALITKYGGSVESSKRLGKIRMAYAIEGQQHGYYVLTYFTADRQALATIDANLRIQTDITRYMVVAAPAGEDAKFDLVSFQEVVVETKEEKRSKRKEAAESTDEVKEEKEDGEKEPAKESTEEKSAE